MKLDLKGLCLIEVSAEGCANCHAMRGELNKAAKENNLNFVYADLETYPEAAEKLKVERIPAIILAEDGKEFARCYGYQPQEILEIWIEAKIEEYLNKE